MSSRRLEDVFSVTIFRLPRRLQDVLEDVKLLCWRHVEHVFKTCLEDVFKTSWKPTNICWGTSQDGSDYWDSKLSTNIQCEKNNHSLFFSFPKIYKNIEKANDIPGILWAFKSRLQIIFAAPYMLLFLPDANNCFFICIIPCIHVCSYYFLILCFYFRLLFLDLLAKKHILQFTVFRTILLQTARNITEIRNTS